MTGLFKEYLGVNLDSSLYFAKEAEKLAQAINDKERQAYMLKNIGIGYYYKGDFITVLDYWKQSLSTFESIGNLKGVANLLSNIGSAYNSTGDYEKALDYHLQTLRIAEKANDTFRKGTALQNIGAVYSELEEYAKAEDYYLQALPICQSIDYNDCIGIVTMNLSQVYREFNQIEKAREQLDIAKELFIRTKNPSLPEAMINAAQLSLLDKDYNRALSEAKEALSISEKNNSKAFVYRSHIVEGKAYLGLKQNESGLEAFKKSVSGRTDGAATVDYQSGYLGLKEAYMALGEYKNATIAQDSIIAINKQLYDSDRNSNISNLQLEFDLEKRENEIALLNADIEKSQLQRNFLMAISSFLFLLIGGVGYMYQYSRKKNKIINQEKDRSDGLLKNILPFETAEELKTNGVVQPKRHDFTTVLFTDFVGFTQISSIHSPETIVSSVDYYFKEFDRIIARNQLEKIKTIGDAYMCAGGLRQVDSDLQLVTLNTLKAAIEIVQFTRVTLSDPPEGIVTFQVRVGIDSGPVVAGVVGQTKFQYDIWGNTVNVASRMETNCEPNRINVSENIYDLLRTKKEFEYRGEIDVKNKGKLKMYYLDDPVLN